MKSISMAASSSMAINLLSILSKWWIWLQRVFEAKPPNTNNTARIVEPAIALHLGPWTLNPRDLVPRPRPLSLTTPQQSSFSSRTPRFLISGPSSHAAQPTIFAAPTDHSKVCRSVNWTRIKLEAKHEWVPPPSTQPPLGAPRTTSSSFPSCHLPSLSAHFSFFIFLDAPFYSSSILLLLLLFCLFFRGFLLLLRSPLGFRRASTLLPNPRGGGTSLPCPRATFPLSLFLALSFSLVHPSTQLSSPSNHLHSRIHRQDAADSMHGLP